MKFLLSFSILINFLLLSRRLSKEPPTAALTTLPTEEAIMYVPENMVSFEELPDIPRPPKQNSTQQDLSTMRKWAKQYGRSSRQLTVRAKSTKGNPGTLPVTGYGRRGLVANPSSSLSEIRGNLHVDSDTPTSDDEDDFDVDCVPVTMNCVSTITFSRALILLISRDERVLGPFLLGNLAQDWKPRMLADTVKVHIYAPDPDNCFLLRYEFTGTVKLHQVVCQLKGDEGITYLKEMNEEDYHQCVMQLSRVTTTQPSPAQTEPASGGHTTRGRPLRLPHR